jgi:hypothetical protein
LKTVLEEYRVQTRSYLKQDLPGGEAGRQAEEDEEQGQGQVLVRHVRLHYELQL